MRVCVAGLWHLGVVTAACLAADGHDVVGFDGNRDVVRDLARGIPPIFEPGLEELVREGLDAGRLTFTSDQGAALSGADVLWITYDTRVDETGPGTALDTLVDVATALVGALDPSAVTLVSSQLPVGTTEGLARGRDAPLAYVPENLRLGDAIREFTQPERLVVGNRPGTDTTVIDALLSPFTARILWMNVESAELTKHALNAFLATSIAFANEVAVIASRVGADPREVAEGLKSDSRVGPRGYLRPGAAFAGGTLVRDIDFLTAIATRENVPAPLLNGVRSSNDEHKRWPLRAVASLLQLRIEPGALEGHRIGVWGLAYKPGTNTLRGSSAVELCRDLACAGARVTAHDVAVTELPEDLAPVIELRPTPIEAVEDALALVVATSWPEYQEISAADVLRVMKAPNVVDADGYLDATLGQSGSVRYVTVARAAV